MDSFSQSRAEHDTKLMRLGLAPVSDIEFVSARLYTGPMCDASSRPCRTSPCTCAYACACACTYAGAHMQVHVQVHLHVHVHVHMHVHMYAHIHVHMHVHLQVHMHALLPVPGTSSTTRCCVQPQTSPSR